MKKKFSIQLLLAVTLCIPFAMADEASKLQPAPKHTVSIDGIEVDIVEQAPHLMVAPMQVFGAFKYEKKNDGFSGADVEMDEGFKGEIQSLRKNHGFGHLAESILLTPPLGGAVVPQKVLFMGLGDIKKFKPEDMKQVGAADVRTACGLGLGEFSHASDVQDGGMTKFNAGIIAEQVVTGIIGEIRTEKALADKGLIKPCNIKKISYLAGPKYLQDTITYMDQAAKKLSVQQ